MRDWTVAVSRHEVATSGKDISSWSKEGNEEANISLVYFTVNRTVQQKRDVGRTLRDLDVCYLVLARLTPPVCVYVTRRITA
jgi:hypothetical protein